MKPELEQQLIAKYPELFRDVNKSPQETCMCWGIEFSGDGWYKIFDDLCDYLTALADHQEMFKVKEEFKTEDNKGYIFLYRPSICFSQVKEKYGTIRVYWIGNGLKENEQELFEQLLPEEKTKAFNKYYEQIENAIDYVSYLSSKVCEICGEPGKLYDNGWVMSRCKKCIVEHYGFDPDDEPTTKF